MKEGCYYSTSEMSYCLIYEPGENSDDSCFIVNYYRSLLEFKFPETTTSYY